MDRGEKMYHIFQYIYKKSLKFLSFSRKQYYISKYHIEYKLINPELLNPILIDYEDCTRHNLILKEECIFI